MICCGIAVQYYFHPPRGEGQGRSLSGGCNSPQLQPVLPIGCRSVVATVSNLAGSNGCGSRCPYFNGLIWCGALNLLQLELSELAEGYR